MADLVSSAHGFGGKREEGRRSSITEIIHRCYEVSLKNDEQTCENAIEVMCADRRPAMASFSVKNEDFEIHVAGVESQGEMCVRASSSSEDDISFSSFAVHPEAEPSTLEPNVGTSDDTLDLVADRLRMIGDRIDQEFGEWASNTELRRELFRCALNCGQLWRICRSAIVIITIKLISPDNGMNSVISL